ncbi:MAG: hypothetical protein HFJ53_04120, partial [Clostridia bacterium]|nr:hypothetical protein [Clostridia bacterium]
MYQKLTNKIIATILITTITLTNFILLGIYTSKTYASNEELEKQKTITNNENVEFDTYFKDQNGQKTHFLSKDINSEDIKLHIYIKVKKGYLKNTKIEISGEEFNESANFKIQNNNTELELVEKIDVNNNEIVLKQINQGTEIVLEVPIVSNKDNKVLVSNFNKRNNVKLTAMYTNDKGKEIEINKTIKVRNEWNGKGKIEIEQFIQR